MLKINITCLLIITIITSCERKIKPQNENSTARQMLAPQDSIPVKKNEPQAIEMSKHIRSIFQDSKGSYWFGTNDAGVYFYDGKTRKQYTSNDGLANNQILNVQEDESGAIWFSTGEYGVSKFDGKTFTTYTENKKINNSDIPNIKENAMWFYAGAGVFHYSKVKNKLNYLPLAKSTQFKTSAFRLSPYAVYSILKDKKGNVWFGTQSQGVCKFDGKNFTWFTTNGLAGSAVLGLFEDSKGSIWFGNNGGGLFRYDGKLLTNITEEKGLSNYEFKTSGKAGPGTLARVYAINEDNNGNLWIGTVDAGAWKYDGTNFTNYTTTNGLTSSAINTIYKDKNGELWFGTDNNGLCKFNGTAFNSVEVK